MDILLFSLDQKEPNFIYEVGFFVDGAFLHIGRKKTLYVNSMNYAYARKKFRNTKVWRTGILKRIISKRKIGVPLEYIPASLFVELKRYAKDVVDVTNTYKERRSVKSKKELFYIKKAVKHTFDIIHSVELKGKTEREVYLELLSLTYENALEPAFKPIVSTLGTSNYPHYIPTNRKLRDHVLIDYGIKFKNYSSDITEVFFLKKSSKMKVYEKLKCAFYDVVDGLNNIELGKEVHQLYEKIFKKYKLRPMPHLIGHGIGLEVHEKPSLSPESKDAIKGAVLAIEPSQYFSNYGLRFERNVYVGKNVRML